MRHDVRASLNLNCNEYGLLDLIMHQQLDIRFSADGWCDLSVRDMSESIILSVGACHGILKRMIEKGLLEQAEDDPNLRRVTVQFLNTVENERSETEHKAFRNRTPGVQKLNDTIYKYIDTNSKIVDFEKIDDPESYPHFEEEVFTEKNPPDQVNAPPEKKEKSSASDVVTSIHLTDKQIRDHMKIVLGRLPEANIQAELYHQCKLHNIRCLLEYKIPKQGGRKGCRLDAVIYDKDRKILLIIETKSYVRKNQEPKLNTVQLNRYRELGVPVMVIGRIEQIQEKVAHILSKYPESVMSSSKEKPAKAKTEGAHRLDLQRKFYGAWQKRFRRMHGFQPAYHVKNKAACGRLIGRISKHLKDKHDPHSTEDVLQAWEYLLDAIAQNGDKWIKERFEPCHILSSFNTTIINIQANANQQPRSVEEIYRRNLEKVRAGVYS